jgi:hypothetical protein
MSGHDIIVIGASAGGVEALQALVGGLPPDIPLPYLSSCIWRPTAQASSPTFSRGPGRCPRPRRARGRRSRLAAFTWRPQIITC